MGIQILVVALARSFAAEDGLRPRLIESSPMGFANLSLPSGSSGITCQRACTTHKLESIQLALYITFISDTRGRVLSNVPRLLS